MSTMKNFDLNFKLLFYFLVLDGFIMQKLTQFHYYLFRYQFLIIFIYDFINAKTYFLNNYSINLIINFQK